jgi:di/tricarboxylate transporter
MSNFTFSNFFQVGSPSNAIVYAAGNFGALTMARVGLLLNLICIGVLFCNTIILGPILFDDFEYKYPNMTYPPGNDTHVQ